MSTMKTETLSLPVKTQTTHKFNGGPWDGFSVRFPRPCVLDGNMTSYVVFPHGVPIETALAWSMIEHGTTSGDAPGSTSNAATYRQDESVPGNWNFVPRATRSR
jgi:hypothetical protein